MQIIKEALGRWRPKWMGAGNSGAWWKGFEREWGVRAGEGILLQRTGPAPPPN